jgi:ethanolamine utilization microcompartment shell protein EutL
MPTTSGGKLVLEKGDDPKDLRKALKVAAAALNRRVRFPFRGEEGSISFYLVRTRGRKAGAQMPKKKRGRPRKSGT